MNKNVNECSKRNMNVLKQLFSRRRLYDELSEEIREHLEEKIEELVAGGMSPKEAGRVAQRFLDDVPRGRHGTSISFAYYPLWVAGVRHRVRYSLA